MNPPPADSLYLILHDCKKTINENYLNLRKKPFGQRASQASVIGLQIEDLNLRVHHVRAESLGAKTAQPEGAGEVQLHAEGLGELRIGVGQDAYLTGSAKRLGPGTCNESVVDSEADDLVHSLLSVLVGVGDVSRGMRLVATWGESACMFTVRYFKHETVRLVRRE